MRMAPVETSLLLVFFFVSGCATHREPVTDPVRDLPPAAAAPAAEDEAARTGLPEEPPVDQVPAADPWLADAEPELAPDPITDDNTPIEDPVSEAPLDELSEVTPELTPEHLEEERQRALGVEPSYDIPMEINPRVLAWVDTYSGRLRESFAGGITRSGRHLALFREIFAEHGVPRDMVYMAAVESGFKTSAYSRAHARGVFQFIAATARRYGLRVDYWVDERSDPEKSARAAAAYMRDLHDEFGDWYLALAAYNAGEGKVRAAIARTGQRDFWTLARTRHLRTETKNHVPAVLAATLIYKDPTRYGFDVEREPQVQYETMTVDGAADLRVLARCVGVEVAQLKELNPALRRNQTPPDGRSDVRVPVGAAEMAMATLAGIPVGERVLYARYQVRRGDTLSVIATRHGVSIASIQQANHLGRGTVIRAGQVLRIPSAAATSYGENDRTWDSEAPEGGAVVIYRVRRGDSLYGIARRHRTTVACIAAANRIAPHKTLHPGERLKVTPGIVSPEAARRAVGGESVIASASSADGRRVHTVRSGETLWRIATRYNTSVDALCSMNEISASSVILPGTKLVVAQR